MQAEDLAEMATPTAKSREGAADESRESAGFQEVLKFSKMILRDLGLAEGCVVCPDMDHDSLDRSQQSFQESREK